MRTATTLNAIRWKTEDFAFQTLLTREEDVQFIRVDERFERLLVLYKGVGAQKVIM